MLANLKTEPRRKTSIALPVDVQDAARNVARRNGISLSEYVVRVVRCDLEARRRQPPTRRKLNSTRKDIP